MQTPDPHRAGTFADSPSTPDQEKGLANALDFYHILQLTFQRKWSLLSLAFLVAMLAALYALSLTPVYRASVSMIIEPPKAEANSLESLFGGYGRNKEYFETQYALLKSRELTERIALNQNLTNHPYFVSGMADGEADPFLRLQQQLSKRLFSFQSPTSIENEENPLSEPQITPSVDDPQKVLNYVVSKLTAGITVSPVTGTHIVNISMDMPDPKAAADIANAVARGYIESQLEARVQMTQSATNWMNTRVLELKEKLQQSEKALQEYKERENLVDIGGVTTLSADSLSASNSRLEDARKEAALLKSQISQIRSIRAADLERLASVPAVMNNSVVQSFTSDLAKAKAKRQELGRRYGPKHPKMITAQAEEQAAFQNLSEQVRQVTSSLEKRYQLAKANISSLEQSFENNTGAIQTISRKQFQFREYQREVEANRALYESFLNRLKESTATSGVDTANARIVDTALVPGYPVKPNKKIIVAIATILALVLGVVLIVVQDLLGHHFNTAEQIEKRLNLPVLGTIPLSKEHSKDLQKLSHLFLTGEDKHFSEAVRGLRTSMMLSNLKDEHQVLMVTSSIPGEGKSSVAMNLALAMGQMKSVLLIDADLRRPKVASSFGQPAGIPGLANLIAGNAELDECLVDIDGITILTTGATPPNPLELLSSPNFGKLVNQFREAYEIVIIDTPPVQAVSDPLMVATHVDQLIYVVKSESTHTDLVEGGVGKILQHKIRIHGIVLNQLDSKKAQYYSYRYGGKYNEYYS